MCFFLYLGSRTEAPDIPWDKEQPALSTSRLNEGDNAVRDKFSLPAVTCIGSDQGCGCGFRNLMFQSGGWPEESMIDSWEPDERTQINHDALVSFLRLHFGSEPFVELYGCWAGDYTEPAAHSEDIGLSQIASPRFYFRDRAHYRVQMTS